MWTVILSPGFISRVCALGVKVARSLSCGLGGPVGTPSVWMKPKLTGSTQLLLQVPDRRPVHSRLSIVSAEHQCVLSQLMLSANGAKPGRVELQLDERGPASREVALAAHWRPSAGCTAASGAEFGSHTSVEIHGATDSSNQWVTSWPGVLHRRRARPDPPAAAR